MRLFVLGNITDRYRFRCISGRILFRKYCGYICQVRITQVFKDHLLATKSGVVSRVR